MGAIPLNRERQTIRSGQARGKLLGGNLQCLLKLAGTPCWPDFTSAIFFIEAYEITAKDCQAAFAQLLQMGVFNKISGAIVGYIDGMQREPTLRPHLEDILLEMTRTYNFPILKINDFGHNCPNAILSVGGEALMDADEEIIEIIAPCVR